MKTKLSLNEYPSILAVISMLDCGVTQDLDWDGHGTPKANIFSLGDDPEPAAGLHGFIASPGFPTLLELNRFCADHMTQYDAVAAEMDRTCSNPENWFWETIPATMN